MPMVRCALKVRQSDEREGDGRRPVGLSTAGARGRHREIFNTETEREPRRATEKYFLRTASQESLLRGPPWFSFCLRVKFLLCCTQALAQRRKSHSHSRCTLSPRNISSPRLAARWGHDRHEAPGTERPNSVERRTGLSASCCGSYLTIARFWNSLIAESTLTTAGGRRCLALMWMRRFGLRS